MTQTGTPAGGQPVLSQAPAGPAPRAADRSPLRPTLRALSAALAAALAASLPPPAAWADGVPARGAGDLGAVSGTVDGDPRHWRVPSGQFISPDRAAAIWERADTPDGPGLQILVEAGDPTGTGHAGAGLVAAMLLAGPDGAGLTAPYLALVGDWPAEALTPDFVYHAEGEVAVAGARLQAPQTGTPLHLELALEARLCAQDIDGRPVDPPAAPRCVDVALQIATAALPHDLIPDAPAPDLRDTPPAAATAAPPSGSPSAPGAEGATLEVLGSVTGTIGRTERAWLTLQGEIRGVAGATAFWRRTEIAIPGFGDTLGAMLDGLPDAERAEIEAGVGALDGLLRGDGPAAKTLGQLSGTRGGAHSYLDLTIGAHDPDSPNILTDGTLTLEISLPDDPVAPGTSLPATVTHVVKSGSLVPQLFYVSGEDGSEGRVTFDRLELEPGGGHAAGRFAATLCRMEPARLMEGADLSDCIPVEGIFDTALGEDTGP